MPPEIDAVGSPPDQNLTAPPERVTPVPPGSNLPALRRRPLKDLVKRALKYVFLLLFLGGGLSWLILNRNQISTDWPVTEAVYDVLGLHIYHFGEGLSFVGVRSELRYDNAKMMLEVEGKIHNRTANTEGIPTITAAAMGVDGKTVQTWQVDPPSATVAPGEEVDFHSQIDAPKDAVSEINLSFVESKHDTDH